MAMKKDNHRRERAKNLLSGKGATCKDGYGANTVKTMTKPTSTPDRSAQGQLPVKRFDKPKRYASGGGVDDESTKKKSSAKTQVNIIIAGKDQPGGAPAGGPPMPPPAAMVPPPGAMPPPGGMPPGMPPKPPGAFKRGGGVPDTKFKAGAGGGEGRLEKAAAEKKRPKGPGKHGGK